MRKGPRFKNCGFELTHRKGRVRLTIPYEKWNDEQQAIIEKLGGELIQQIIEAETGRRERLAKQTKRIRG